MDIRLQKGEQIAKTSQVKRKAENEWLVASQSGKGFYSVMKRGNDLLCTCPDYEQRRQPCKHVHAVQITVLQWFDINGKKIAEVKRITYPQNWSAYNKAQTNEQELFMKLLADLCENIEEPLYKFGRPQLSLEGMAFGSALKVYSTFSLRRFICDMRTAKEKGYVDAVCSYSSVSNYMRNKDLTPILQNLITL